MGAGAFLCRRAGNRTHFNASVRWTLANRRLDADCSLRFAPLGVNRQSIPVPCSKRKGTPMGCLFFWNKRAGNRTHSNASVQRTLANRRLDADCSLRFAPQGQIGNRFPYPSRRTKSNPLQCKCPVDTCQSTARRRLLLTVCPLGVNRQLIPVPCSIKRASTRMGAGAFYVAGQRIEPTSMQVSGGHLPIGGSTPIAPYDLPPRGKSAIDSRTLLQKKRHPYGVSFLTRK